MSHRRKEDGTIDYRNQTAFDPKELRRLVEPLKGPLGTKGDEQDLAEYVVEHLDAILAVCEGHAAARDAIKELADALDPSCDPPPDKRELLRRTRAFLRDSK